MLSLKLEELLKKEKQVNRLEELLNKKDKLKWKSAWKLKRNRERETTRKPSKKMSQLRTRKLRTIITFKS